MASEGAGTCSVPASPLDVLSNRRIFHMARRKGGRKKGGRKGKAGIVTTMSAPFGGGKMKRRGKK